MIIKKTGDVLTSTAQIIAHQVNCMGVMGAGLAKQIKEQHPNVYDTYKTMCDLANNGYALLGMCLLVQIENKSQQIANLFGQYTHKAEFRQTNYEAIYLALESCEKQMKEKNLTSIAFPFKLSSGLAGANWNIIMAMITAIFDKTDSPYHVEIWEYK
jgi:O-acetyl-ADP-ribose deacetylase (regulator of RNase III)